MIKLSKRGLLFLLSALLLCGSVLTVFSAPVAESFALGDVNQDHEIGLSDVTMLAKYIAGWSVSIGTTVAGGKTLSLGDANGDGEVALSDLTLLAKYIAGWDVVLGGEKPPEPFAVHVCLASEPGSIDPLYASSTDAAAYVLHQFEGLMKFAVTDQALLESGRLHQTRVVPGQAASCTVSEDLLSYTFTLRDDLFWSDGQPVTAHDFVYSWQRLVDPDLDADYGYILDGVVENAAAIRAGEAQPETLGITALRDQALRITLEAPCPYFLELCALPCLVPLRRDLIQAAADWTEPENIVVNGAYRLTEWEHGDYLRMEQNPDYYDAESLGPDAIVWHLDEDEDAVFDAYSSGDYSFINNVPADRIAALIASGDCVIAPAMGVYYLDLNCEKITDWRVRAALTLAVDRENLTSNVLGGGQRPAQSFVASGITDSAGADFALSAPAPGTLCQALQDLYPDYDLSTYQGRCRLARALYDEAIADESWSAEAMISYHFNQSSGHSRIASACIADWERVLGVNVSPVELSWSGFGDMLAEGSYDIARDGWFADYNDPTSFLDLLVSGSHTRYSDPEYDKAVAAAKALPAGAERDALLRKAEAILFSQGAFPVCPLYYYTNLSCIRDLSGVGYSPYGYYCFAYSQPLS